MEPCQGASSPCSLLIQCSRSSLHLRVQKGRGGQTWAKKKRPWSAPPHTMFESWGGHSGVDPFQQQKVLAGGDSDCGLRKPCRTSWRK